VTENTRRGGGAPFPAGACAIAAAEHDRTIIAPTIYRLTFIDFSPDESS
jgi:hypothetical protein